MSNIFDKLAPLYVSKDALDHLLVHSRSKHCLRKTKNLVFSLFCILVDIPKGGLQPPLFPGYAIGYHYSVYLSSKVAPPTSDSEHNQYQFEFSIGPNSKENLVRATQNIDNVLFEKNSSPRLQIRVRRNESEKIAKVKITLISLLPKKS